MEKRENLSNVTTLHEKVNLMEWHLNLHYLWSVISPHDAIIEIEIQSFCYNFTSMNGKKYGGQGTYLSYITILGEVNVTPSHLSHHRIVC